MLTYTIGKKITFNSFYGRKLIYFKNHKNRSTLTSKNLHVIFLMCCWILITRILLRIFASMFISDIGLQFSFFVTSLSGFGIRVMVASQNEFGSLPSSAIFWKSLSRIGVSSSQNFWQNSAVKLSEPGLLFAGRFLITVSISVLVIGLLRSSISSWFS